MVADAGGPFFSPVAVRHDFLHKVHDLGDVLADSGEDIRGKDLQTERVSRAVFAVLG